VTGRRVLLLGALGWLAAGGAVAQEERGRPSRRRPRRAAPEEPLPLPPEPPAPPRADLAPVPNRGIEAPHGAQRDVPSFELDVIEPRLTPRGGTFESDQVQRRQDRLFEPAPGARFRLPFAY
jgi:hypothetical protein